MRKIIGSFFLLIGMLHGMPISAQEEVPQEEVAFDEDDDLAIEQEELPPDDAIAKGPKVTAQEQAKKAQTTQEEQEPVQEESAPADDATDQDEDAVQEQVPAQDEVAEQPEPSEPVEQEAAAVPEPTEETQEAGEAKEPSEDSAQKKPEVPEKEPEKPKRVQPAPEEVDPEPEFTGPQDVKIDTIDLTEPKGNWLLKRWWWEQAEILYEKIKQREEEVFEERMEFLRKRIDIDRNLFNPFYKNVGIGQGELSETIAMLVSQLENERKKVGVLSEQERAFLDVLQTEKKTLAQLQENVNAVSDADLAIDDALLKLMEQINKVRSYERQAWDRFKAIARELSDQRAYELYEEMKGLSRNVTDILAYIRQPFQNYFQNLSGKATEEIEKIKTDIQALKEKGIDLKQESLRLDVQQSQKEDQERQQACAVQVKKVAAQVQAQKRGWFDTIADFFALIGRTIVAPFNYIAGWFKAPTKPVARRTAQAVQGQEVSVQKEASGQPLPAFPEPPLAPEEPK